MRRRLASALGVTLLLLTLQQGARAQSFSTSLPPDAKAAMDRAEREMLDGDQAAAERDLETFVKAVPDWPRGYDMLRFSRLNQGADTSELAARYKTLTEASPNRAGYWYAYGRFVADPAERERAFSRVVALAPDAPWGYYGLGFAAKSAGDMAKAVGLYEKAHAMAPADTGITSATIDTYWRTPGREADARKLLETFLATPPDAYDTQNALLQSAKWAPEGENLRLFSRYLERYPKGIWVAFARQNELALIARKDQNAAAAHAREVAKTSVGPDRAIALAFLLDDAQGRDRAALDTLVRDVVEWKVTDPFIYTRLAYAYGDESDYVERADPLLRKAIELAEAQSPRDEQLVANLKLGYEVFKLNDLASRDKAAAVAQARARMRTVPIDQVAPFLRLVVNDVSTQGPKAVEALAKEMLANKDFGGDAAAVLADAYDAESMDPDVATELIGRVIGPNAPRSIYSMRPEFASRFRVQLAQAQMRKGNVKEAIASLEAADPKHEDANVAAALGRTYGKIGDTTKAFDAFVLAATIAPNPAVHAALLDAAKAANRTPAEADAAVAAAREARARPASDFTLTALGGGQVSLASLRGKVVLVNFWFPGCGPCRAEFPHLQELYERYRAQGFEVVAIDTTSDDAGARRFIEQKKITFRSLTGNTQPVAASYGVTATPYNAVIDRDGRLYFTAVGFGGDESIEVLRAIIEPLLARRPAGGS